MSLRFIHDRKHKLTKDGDPIELRMTYNRRTMYISTGIRVRARNWDDDRQAVVRMYDVDTMDEYNDTLDELRGAVKDIIRNMRDNKETISLDKGKQRLLQPELDFTRKDSSFIEYVRFRINQRTDITDSTKRSQMRLVYILEQYKQIQTFNDLNKAQVMDFYEWLSGRRIVKTDKEGKKRREKMKTPTVWSYMKLLRTYIHDAMRRDIITTDPSIGIRVKKGESEPGRWLTEEDLERIRKVKSLGVLTKIRDLFLFQCYTGIAFADTQLLTKSNLEYVDGMPCFIGNRKKTGEQYIVLAMESAMAIWKKYKGKLPRITNQQYNIRLKWVAEKAGIDKPIASHWGRRTFGYLALNKGIRIETVSRCLGHKTTIQTQTTYGKILKKTVVKELKDLHI